MIESMPTLRQVLLMPVYLRPVDLVEASAQPLLDETGNVILGEDGSILYAE